MEAACVSRGEWMDKEIEEYMYNEILFSYNEHSETMKNIWNFAICDNMDGSWGIIVSEVSQDRERQIPNDLT